MSWDNNSWGGRGGGKRGGGKGGNEKWDWGVDGFGEALIESLTPHVAIEPKWSLKEMEEKVGYRIIKIAKTFNHDARLQQNSKTIMARVVLEEFVIKAMSSMAVAFYDRPWLYKVNFTKPLLASAMHTFQDSKLFVRCLAPALEKYVEEAIFVWAEDERIGKAIFDTVESFNMKDSYKKKACNFLQKSFDDAHFKAPYGTHVNADPGLGMLMDFTKAWMSDFCGEGYNCLSIGLGDGNSTKPEQIQYLIQLFQILLSSQCACLPRQLSYMLTEPPPNPWPFLKDCAEQIFEEYLRKPHGSKKAGDTITGVVGYGPLVPQPALGEGAFGRPY